MLELTRNEIAGQLRNWMTEGKLFTKRSTGMTYATINHRISKGLFFPTPFDSIVCSDESVRDAFVGLVDEGRVMDSRMLKLKKTLLTQYSQNMACANGQLLRFADLGHAAVLFID